MLKVVKLQRDSIIKVPTTLGWNGTVSFSRSWNEPTGWEFSHVHILPWFSVISDRANEIQSIFKHICGIQECDTRIRIICLSQISRYLYAWIFKIIYPFKKKLNRKNTILYKCIWELKGNIYKNGNLLKRMTTSVWWDHELVFV